jgi:hypothetical protein
MKGSPYGLRRAVFTVVIDNATELTKAEKEYLYGEQYKHESLAGSI